MIVFSSSTAGSNRGKLEEKVAKMAKANGKKVRIINFVDKMMECAKPLNMNITPSTIPNLDPQVIKVLKENAMHRISDMINAEKDADFIIDGHTAFWWKNGPIGLMDVRDFSDLRPDLFVTIISTPAQLKDTILKDKEWLDKEIDIYEISVWSELEIYTMDLISRTLGKSNYLVGIDEDPVTIYNLMYNPWMLKIYTSFSMEHRDTSYKRLDRFISRLREMAIVFDPRSVDLSYYGEYYKDSRIKEIAFNQTVRRDYRLIDQSDIVVIHLTSLVYSSGVDSERMHAHSTGKRVLLYFPFEKYSPFTPYFVNKMFNNEEELINEISKLASRTNGRKVKKS